MELEFTRMIQVATADITRRGLLKSTVAPALAGLGLTAFLAADDAEGRRRKKGKKKRCKKAGKSCTKDKQCCTKKGLICEVPVNGSNSDTYCCGGDGAKCGGNNEDGDDLSPFCCNGFRCNSDTESPGTCVPVPPDE